jgi:hypothetical protein
MAAKLILSEWYEKRGWSFPFLAADAGGDEPGESVGARLSPHLADEVQYCPKLMMGQ